MEFNREIKSVASRRQHRFYRSTSRAWHARHSRPGRYRRISGALRDIDTLRSAWSGAKRLPIRFDPELAGNSRRGTGFTDDSFAGRTRAWFLGCDASAARTRRPSRRFSKALQIRKAIAVFLSPVGSLFLSLLSFF
jgi:hypothetical protein